MSFKLTYSTMFDPPPSMHASYQAAQRAWPAWRSTPLAARYICCGASDS